jgi:hypothetical protein
LRGWREGRWLGELSVKMMVTGMGRSECGLW